VQIVAGSGHTPQTEKPEQFNALLSAFVDEVTA
jgi:pimeloyl-ACP methyl ester carboxylesterase